MEIKGTIHMMQKLVRSCLCMFVLVVVFSDEMIAQPAARNYSVKNNRMYIALGKLYQIFPLTALPASIISMILH